MATNSNNKNKMYEFEKLAIVMVVVLAVVISLIVVFSTKGNKRGDVPNSNPSDFDTDVNSGVEEGSADDVASGENNNSTADDTSDSSNAQINSKIDFVKVVVDNSLLSSGDLVLVNLDNPFLGDVSSSLINVYDYKQNNSFRFSLVDSTVQLQQHVVDNLGLMVDQFYEDFELQNLVITRSYNNSDSSSEHTTGLAYHLVVYPNSGDGMGQGAYNWFYENCWRYGFVLRYTADKQPVTRVDAEAEHFRYVGKPHATYMYLKSLALEEYLSDLQQTTNYTSRLKLDVGSENVVYETYAVKAGDGLETEIMVPADDSGWSYEVSGSCNGYFIVTIMKIN